MPIEESLRELNLSSGSDVQEDKVFARFDDIIKLLILEKILAVPALIDPDGKFIMVSNIRGGDCRFAGVGAANRLLNGDAKSKQQEFKTHISNFLKVDHFFQTEGIRIILRNQAVAFNFGPGLESAFRIHGHAEITGLLAGQKKRAEFLWHTGTHRSISPHTTADTILKGLIGESMERPVQVLWPESIKTSKLAYCNLQFVEVRYLGAIWGKEDDNSVDDSAWHPYCKTDLSKIPSYIEMHMSAFPRLKRLAIDFVAWPEDDVLPQVQPLKAQGDQVYGRIPEIVLRGLPKAQSGVIVAQLTPLVRDRGRIEVTGSHYDMSVAGPGSLIEVQPDRIEWTTVRSERL